jgi:hypothetical protein
VIGGAQIDATVEGSVKLLNLQALDLAGEGASSIRINAGVVDGLAPNSDLQYFASADDDLVFTDVADWRMGDPILDGNQFLQTAVQPLGGKQIRALVPTPFNNLIDASDVNNDGAVSGSDALAIINELVRHRYSLSDVGTVVDPTTLDPWPNSYGDQSGDNLVTALDALRVINDLARRLRLEGEALPIITNDNVETSGNLPALSSVDSGLTDDRQIASSKTRGISQDPSGASIDAASQRNARSRQNAGDLEEREATTAIDPDGVDQLLSSHHRLS